MIAATGGWGFIGAHNCVELARQGSRAAVVDNLSNAKPSALDRIRELAAGSDIGLVHADIRNAGHWQLMNPAGCPD